MRDMVTDSFHVASIKAQTLSGAGTTNGSSADLQGFEAATILIHTGADTGLGGGKNILYKIEESDDDSVFTDVDAVPANAISESTDYVPDAASILIDDDALTDVAYRLGYRGTKRFIRVVAVVTGAISSTSYGAIVLQQATNTPDKQTVV